MALVQLLLSFSQLFFYQTHRLLRKIQIALLNPTYLTLTGLFFVSRFILILWGLNRVSHYEELEQGYIAVELLTGLRARLLDYQVDEYTGGTIFTSLLAVPFFIMFGPVFFSLKILALMRSFFSFTLIYFMIRRYAGKKPALFTGLFLIFSPPLLYKTSLMALGSHEWLLPSMLMLFFLVKHLSEKKHRLLSLALMGVFWGLSVSVSYINLVAVLACMGTLLIAQQVRWSWKEWISLIAGFLVGASYWFTYNFTHNWSGLKFLSDSTIFREQTTLQECSVTLARGFYRFFAYFSPHALSFRSLGMIPANFINYFYFIALIVIILPDMAKNLLFFKTKFHERNINPASAQYWLKIFFGLYLIFFPIIYSLSQYQCYTLEAGTYHYRYFIPFFSIIILYLSLLISQKRFRNLLLGAFLILGFLSQGRTVWGQPFGEAFKKPGFKSGIRNYIWQHPSAEPLFLNLKDFRQRASSLAGKEGSSDEVHAFVKIANQEPFWASGTTEEIIDAITELPLLSLRRYFFRRWAFQLNIFFNESDRVTINRIGEIVPLLYRRDFYLGAAQRLNFSEWTEMSDVRRFIEHSDTPYKELFLFCWGSSLYKLHRNGYEAEDLFRQKMSYVATLPDSEKIWIYRGMGEGIFRFFRAKQIVKINMTFLNQFIPKKFHEEPLWGVGWYLGRRYFLSPSEGLARLEALEPPQKTLAYQGLRDFYKEMPDGNEEIKS